MIISIHSVANEGGNHQQRLQNMPSCDAKMSTTKNLSVHVSILRKTTCSLRKLEILNKVRLKYCYSIIVLSLQSVLGETDGNTVLLCTMKERRTPARCLQLHGG